MLMLSIDDVFELKDAEVPEAELIDFTSARRKAWAARTWQ